MTNEIGCFHSDADFGVTTHLDANEDDHEQDAEDDGAEDAHGHWTDSAAGHREVGTRGMAGAARRQRRR